ncbi:MAG: SUMF1/EgtB/PvdO family nonheme iron enzyme, partial [Verrucomicrobiota bacterium]
MTPLKLLLPLSVLFVSTAHAQLGSLGFNFTSPAGQDNGASLAITGFRFQVTSAINVSGLAAFNPTAPAGLGRETKIGLWSDDGTLLVSVSIPSGTAPIAGSYFSGVAVTPLTLQPGIYRIAGDGYRTYIQGGPPTGFSGYSHAPELTYLSSCYNASGNSFSFPNLSDDNSFLNVNILLQAPTEAPTITKQPESQTAVLGQSASLVVEAKGTPALTYQWLKGEGEIPDATSASYTINSVAASDAGDYRVRVSNGVGDPVLSNVARLTVHLPPQITTQPLSRTVLVGEPVTFSVEATGIPAPGYQWQKNDSDLTGATGSSYTIAAAQLSDAGDYRVLVSNGVGNPVPSKSAKLVVMPATTTPPVVSNVRATQRTGTKLVEVTYDLADPDSETVAISLSISADAGLTYNVPVLTVSGDIGSSVRPGLNKQILWNAGTDWNGRFTAQGKARVTAQDASSPDGVPPGIGVIAAGGFAMGDPPTRSVNVSAFYIDKFEVTLGLWLEVLSWAVGRGYSFENIGSGQAPDHPVHSVSWYDAVKWCNARSEMAGRTPVYYTDATQTVVYRTGNIDLNNDAVKWNADGYRLPTEAEWEKAARGGLVGHHFPWPSFNGSATGFEIFLDGSKANYFDSGDPFESKEVRTTPVGYYDGKQTPAGTDMANGFGLYDMAGNVREWCWNWAAPLSESEENDPHGPSRNSLEFKITSLSGANSAVIDHEGTTGDDRGGIAVSNGQVFVTGDTATGRYNLNLSEGVSVGRLVDRLCSDLRSETVYSLGHSGREIVAPDNVNSLIELDPQTGSR